MIEKIAMAQDFFALAQFSFAHHLPARKRGGGWPLNDIRPEEFVMRIVTAHILPLVIAVSASALLLSAAIV
jgi:hypothetical protein